MMPQTLGIDFGTSNTAAGLMAGPNPYLIEVEPGKTTLPTSLFFDTQRKVTTYGSAANTALIDGVRKFAMDVRELDIDLIDRINPFEAAYSVLAKAMNEGTLKQVAAVIGKRKVSIPYDEARDLAVRALQWKKERGRAPEITSQDPWEKRLAEGVAALAKFRAEQNSQEGGNG